MRSSSRFPSRPRRSTSPGAARARCGGSTPRARAARRTRRSSRAAGGRTSCRVNASTDHPTWRHDANTPDATMTTTLESATGEKRSAVRRASGSRSKHDQRERGEPAEPDAHRGDVQRVDRDRERRERAGGGVTGEPGSGGDREPERYGEHPPPRGGPPAPAEHEQQGQGRDEQREPDLGEVPVARVQQDLAHDRRCGRSPTTGARPRTDLGAATPTIVDDERAGSSRPTRARRRGSGAGRAGGSRPRTRRRRSAARCRRTSDARAIAKQHADGLVAAALRFELGRETFRVRRRAARR